MPYAMLKTVLDEALDPATLRAVPMSIVSTAGTPSQLPQLVEQVHDWLERDYDSKARKFIELMPVTMQEAIRASVFAAFSYGVTMNLLFRPAYAYSFTCEQWGEPDEGGPIVNLIVAGPDPLL
jgi:hypothetical protein